MKLKYLLISLAVSSLTSNVSLAESCQKIEHHVGQQQTVYASLNHYTHIILPKNLLPNTKPLVGNPDLWTAEHAGPHIWIKPKSALKPGKSTSVSVVDSDKNSYDFTVKRILGVDIPCYELVVANQTINDLKTALSTNNGGSGVSNDAISIALNEQKQRLSEKFTNERKDAVIRALRAYRFHIYTRYRWEHIDEDDAFIGNDLISDVYDDGRFTYIRVHRDNKGLMTIKAKLNGQSEIVDFDFDPVSKIYTVSGIYPKFTLQYADTTLDVMRANNKTRGDY